MKLKKQLAHLIPAPLRRALRIQLEKRWMNKIQPRKCDTSSLAIFTQTNQPNHWFASLESELDEEWHKVTHMFAEHDIPDGTEGVNRGDRRAIYYVVRRLKPASVLEIGTHVGASTIHIAAALHKNQFAIDADRGSLISVDVKDVNNSFTKPWLKYGASRSPAEMVESMGFDGLVEFLTTTSIGYLQRCQHRFDLIFLDGDHSARTVYQEIPMALEALSDGGIILLHDYFPNLEPLWADGTVIPGPYLAVQRLRREGAKIGAWPLGKLPWPTKMESNVTSLALLVQGTMECDHN